jgi:hypothetical protein
MTATATRTPPTLDQFKRWARDSAPVARAVCLAQAYAELERERVDAYIRPIFDRYKFEYAARWSENPDGTPYHKRIPDPAHLYLCDDEPGLKAFYADCDDAHRAHGFTGPEGHCPALRAEHLLLVAQSALIDLAKPLFGFDSTHLYGEDRRKCLDLLLGACLKADKEARRS